MKRFITNILFFFATVTIVDFCIGYVGDYFQTHAKGGATRVLNDLVRKDKHDILILGSSRAHSHYDTPFLSDTLGIDVYNAGYDGNGIVLSYGILEMILDRYNPQLVIYDVEPSFDINVYKADNNNKRYLNLLKPYYRDNGIASIFKDISGEEWLKVHSGMMRYNTRILSTALDNIKGETPFCKGYKPLKGVYRPQEKFPLKENNGHYLVDSVKIEYMKKMIELTQSSQVPIIMVASPKYLAESSSVFDPIKHVCSEYKIPFLDYYADGNFSQENELFNEPMHLNASGARLFSKILLNDIKCQIR